jgi:hypothetical protein
MFSEGIIDGMTSVVRGVWFIGPVFFERGNDRLRQIPAVEGAHNVGPIVLGLRQSAARSLAKG